MTEDQLKAIEAQYTKAGDVGRLVNEVRRLTAQIEECYAFLIAGLDQRVFLNKEAGEHMVASMRAQPLLVHFKMAANTIASQTAEADARELALRALAAGLDDHNWDCPEMRQGMGNGPCDCDTARLRAALGVEP